MKHKKLVTPKVIVSKSIFVFLIVVLGFFSVSLLREVKRKQAIQQEIQHLEDELVRLEPDNQQLSTLIEYLQTDEYAELEAKKRLGMKREGEQVILVTEEKTDTINLVAPQNKENTNWELWWNHFFY